MNLYAIECGFWPWISRRKAGDVLREQARAHTDELLGQGRYFERVRQHLGRENDELKQQIKELQAEAGQA